MERCSSDPGLDHVVVWNGSTIAAHLGGFTKGELLDPRDERTNPVFLNGEAHGTETVNRDIRMPSLSSNRKVA